MTTIASTNPTWQALREFGLEERVIRLYISLLELGEASILELSKRAGVERTVIYYLLKELRRLGLVKEAYGKGNRLRLIANPPDRLLNLASERKKLVEDALPDLRAIFNERKQNKPKIQLFEGLAGIDAMYDDVLATVKGLPLPDREVLTYISMDLYSQLPLRNQASFREARKQNQIRMRAISEDTPLGREFQQRDKEELRELRFIADRKQPFQAAFIIYGDKVAQYNLKGQLFVMVIEDKGLADLQRTAFDLAWQSVRSL